MPANKFVKKHKRSPHRDSFNERELSLEVTVDEMAQTSHFANVANKDPLPQFRIKK